MLVRQNQSECSTFYYVLIESKQITLQVLEACLTLQLNHFEMTDSILSQEEFSKLVLGYLMSSESGLTRFNVILQLAGLEKELLQISSYENAEFILKEENIKQIHQPKIDRLTLVHPPSFAFSVDYQISGHFNVKYNAASNPLPIQMEPFIVNYSGILIPHDASFEIKNEKIVIKDQ